MYLPTYLVHSCRYNMQETIQNILIHTYITNISLDNQSPGINIGSRYLRYMCSTHLPNLSTPEEVELKSSIIHLCTYIHTYRCLPAYQNTINTDRSCSFFEFPMKRPTYHEPTPAPPIYTTRQALTYIPRYLT